MGKRQHQTTAKGNFVFPVVSLQENLIVTLHDTEGNAVSQTVLQTATMVKKGIWEDLFPLKGGGNVRMKLQFSLSEEERKRIREMRESALKRKRGELLKDGPKGSISGKKFQCLIPYPIAELVSKGALISQSEQTDPDECSNPLTIPSLQELKHRSKGSFEQIIPCVTQVNKGTIKIHSPPNDIQERQVSPVKDLDPHTERLESFVLRNMEEINLTSAEMEEDQVRNPKRMYSLQRSSGSNVKKMISAFEINVSQALGPHVGSRTQSPVRKMYSEGSLNGPSSKESDINKLKLPQTMAKSFSADMLSEINFLQNPKFSGRAVVKNEIDMVDMLFGTRWEIMGKHTPTLNFKIFQDFENLESGKLKALDIKVEEGSSVDTLPFAQSHSSKGKNTVLRSIECEEAVGLGEFADHIGVREDHVPIEVEKGSNTSLHKDSNVFVDKIEQDFIPKGGCSLDAHTAQQTSSVMPSSGNFEELEAIGTKDGGYRTDDDNGTIKGVATNYFQLAQEVNLKAVDTEKNKYKEHTEPAEHQLSRKMFDKSVNVDGPYSLSTYQQNYTFDAVMKDTDCGYSRSRSDEQIVFGTLNEVLILSTFFHYIISPFGNPDNGIPRHLCITTGSKQLRNLSECFCVEIYQADTKLSSMEANEQSKVHDDKSIEVKKNEVSYSSEKPKLVNSFGIPKLNGTLIEQGLKILVVTVACATLLLNAVQRKPR